MAVILDTGILYAYYDRRDSWHRRARNVIEENRGALILPAPAIPEVDHLIGARLGTAARMTLYEGLAGGHFFVAELPAAGYRRVAELNRRFAALELGFVDAAVIVIAETLGLLRIATTDRRDFGALAEDLGLELVP